MCNLSWTPHSNLEKDNSLNHSCVSPKMGCLEYTNEELRSENKCVAIHVSRFSQRSLDSFYSEGSNMSSTGPPPSTVVDIDVHPGDELANFNDNQHLSTL